MKLADELEECKGANTNSVICSSICFLHGYLRSASNAFYLPKKKTRLFVVTLDFCKYDSNKHNSTFPLADVLIHAKLDGTCYPIFFYLVVIYVYLCSICSYAQLFYLISLLLQFGHFLYNLNSPLRMNCTKGALLLTNFFDSRITVRCS